MPSKQRRGEATVDRLLDAALQVYVTEGEQGFTVKAVTDRSKVSLGSLYHHFGSLDGLFEALALRCLSRLFDELVTALAQAPNARAGVYAVVEAYLDFVRDHEDAALLLHSPAADRRGMAQGADLRDTQEARLAAFAEWVQTHVESGELAQLPLPLYESLVLGPVVGTARRWLSGIRDIGLDEAARVLPERIWRSVSAEQR
ncbi:TetR/AcrR family transcriptional regulator [Streptomyces sp. NPDC056479]|uniref:TetR/AcrR family transcriptional regulator n=1 Tax=Streptomyces sp. NPDC056479 TaxID=3345832 RepID=UPI003680DC8E